MKKPNVLIIARDFVPYCFSFGGVVRVLKLAEYLGEHGIEVFVLAAKGEEISYYGYRELVRSLKVTYLEDRLQPLLNRITNTSSDSSLQKINRTSAAFRLFKKLVNEISIPDVGVFFVGKFIREAARMVRRHGIRNVLVTSPPPSMLLAGYALKRKFGDRINLIVDYRDSWNLGYVGRKRFPLADRLNRALETGILRRADRFLHVSQPILDGLATRVPDLAARSTLVMNGYDAKQVAPAAPPSPVSEKLRIGHFGRLLENETQRNPGLLFEAVERFGDSIRLVLFGDVSVSGRWKERLGGIVDYRGVVSHEEALRQMAEMDVLLLYHSEREGSKEVVTGKLFEYMLARRPILVLGPPDMEAAAIVREEQIGYVADLFDPKSVDSTLRSILDLWREGNLVRYDIGSLERYSRQHQYSKILPLLA